MGSFGNCCICLEDFDDQLSLSATPCGHVFHTECIQQYIENQDSSDEVTCPHCREEFFPQDLISIYLQIRGNSSENRNEVLNLKTELSIANTSKILLEIEKSRLEQQLKSSEEKADLLQLEVSELRSLLVDAEESRKIWKEYADQVDQTNNDLRRENTSLKETVVEKGRKNKELNTSLQNLTAVNSILVEDLTASEHDFSVEIDALRASFKSAQSEISKSSDKDLQIEILRNNLISMENELTEMKQVCLEKTALIESLKWDKRICLIAFISFIVLILALFYVFPLQKQVF